VTVHSAVAGAGVDFQWRYIHLAAGYRLSYPFFSSAKDPDTRDRLLELKSQLGELLEDKQHGFSVEIGARF
jgi:hypothetical protein